MKKSKGEYKMKLEKVKINKYKTYEIEQEVSIENDYTVLVGMNESGKTSLLEAITKANSYRTNDALSKFNVVTDYTRRFKKQLDKSGENPVAIELVFLLENTELKKLNDFLNTSYDTFSFKYLKKQILFLRPALKLFGIYFSIVILLPTNIIFLLLLFSIIGIISSKATSTISFSIPFILTLTSYSKYYCTIKIYILQLLFRKK